MNSLLQPALLAACLLSLESLIAKPVDFTPRQVVTELDGVQFNDILFRHGTGGILYRPPQGWTATGDSEHLYFKPGAASSARVEFTHIDNSPAPAWDEDGLQILQQRALATLPPALDLKFDARFQNPVTINGNRTVMFTFSGVLFSEKYKFMVVLLPLADEQFNFVFYAPEKEFDKPSKQFQGSLFGLQWR